MSVSKINILGIVPYESMKNVLLRTASSYKEININVFVGNLEEGARIALQNQYRSYDVIISRGGTVDMIRRRMSIPVVGIPLSSYDILKTLEMAQSYSGKMAVVGFSNITANVNSLVQILKYDIPIYTLQSQEEAGPVLSKLHEEGTQIIISDTITDLTARRMNLHSILLNSGYESMNSALIEAINLVNSLRPLQRDNDLLRNVIQNVGQSIVIFDGNQSLMYSTWDPDDNEGISFLRQYLPDVWNGQITRFFHVMRENTLFSVTGKVLSSGSSRYAVFFMQAIKVPMISSKYGISFLNFRQVQEQYYSSFFNMRVNYIGINKIVESYSRSRLPVMITGEPGTGKEQVAKMLFLDSDLKNNPFVIINCSLITSDSWKFLTNHYSSPLNDKDVTLYFQNINCLDEEAANQLLSICVDTNMYQRSRLIFSCAVIKGNQIPPIAKRIITQLSCLQINLPPVREQKLELSSTCNLYLNAQSSELNKEIVGFDSSAMDLMLRYDWPGNFTQVKRVINALCVIASGSYITATAVKSVLDQERLNLKTYEDRNNLQKKTDLNLDRSLDEITKDIINMTIEKYGGNQSAAARQLGISRTTLWRYLSKVPKQK